MATGGSCFAAPLAGMALAASSLIEDGTRFASASGTSGSTISGSVNGWRSPSQTLPLAGSVPRSRYASIALVAQADVP